MRIGMVAGLVVGIALGCSRTGPGGAAGQSALLEKLPAGAGLVVGYTRGASEKEMSDGLAGLPMQDKQVPKCAMDLFAKLESAVVAVAFAGKVPQVSVAARGAGLHKALDACLPELKMTTAAAGKATAYTASNETVYARWLDDDTIVVGPYTDAKATEELGQPPSPLAKDATIQSLLADAKPTNGFWALLDVARVPAAGEMLPAQIPAPRRAWMSLADDLALRATLELASPADAEKVKGLLTQALSSAPPMVGAFTKDVVIKTEGSRVVASAPLGEALAGVTGGKMPSGKVAPVAAVGVLAAIAIPAFMKNARKAKTSEAVTNVKKLYEGARSFYEEDASKHFPQGHVGPTPPLGACCKAPEQKCPPDPALWTDPTWNALKFSMDDPHLYSYEYKSEGEGTDAKFTVTAFGDLDCDGVYSTFEMTGQVGGDGSVTGQAGLFRDHELE